MKYPLLWGPRAKPIGASCADEKKLTGLEDTGLPKNEDKCFGL